MRAPKNEIDFSDCSFLAGLEAGGWESACGPRTIEGGQPKHLGSAPRSRFDARLVAMAAVALGQLLMLVYFLFAHF